MYSGVKYCTTYLRSMYDGCLYADACQWPSERIAFTSRRTWQSSHNEFAALGDLSIWAGNVEDNRINMNDLGIPTLQPVERVLDLMSVYLSHPCSV